ncbi:MAG: RNA pseudouridine synthase [Flexistipes sinusarabici]|uniref:RNA pseudouridine synthase n=1 Tax=Flexistipes sinusarabici TaxID=2352 RepID=A0A5D0MJG9_FLESI|nr:RNA pseudouridine synthase [Flexistipes sinusarabici]TYB33874.1 MAG: RNA pseudouridine synthase [Flexistipes sinusarabici]
MKKEKAYKLLSAQEGISNRAAKDLIDRGLVFAGSDHLKIGRTELPVDTVFKIRRNELDKVEVLFEDENLFAVNKSPYLTSYEVSQICGFPLIHRLDKGTSGVLLMAKNESFRKKAVELFKNQNVTKEYMAWISGVLAEDMYIDKNIKTHKHGKAKSYIDSKGKPAKTFVSPLEVSNKCTKVLIKIYTGRTHQIRVHLQDAGFSILGDTEYGGRKHHRIMLHAKGIEMPGYTIEAPEPADFS